MRLDTLIDNLPLTLRCGVSHIALTDVTDDSRAVRPGGLFIARPGSDGDAMRFVPSAIEAGAVAVLLSDGQDQSIGTLPGHVAVVCAEPGVAIDQRLCGKLAERFYDHPSAKLKLLGVTGTNGKTTTVTIAKHLLESAGHKCGLIGTVELDTGSPTGPTPATLTTPGAIELSKLLAEMVRNGCGYCVMEVSSHALHQGRADHVRFAAAAFTNLTQDHLDYHGDMQSYADAKAILFESLDEDAVAVLNADDAASSRMARGCPASICFTTVQPVATDPPNDNLPADRYAVTPTRLTAADSRATYTGAWGTCAATLPTPGIHNLSNAIQAATLVHAADLTADQLKQALETCRPVPGRLESVGPTWPHADAKQREASGTALPIVLVDYAHTPDALLNVGKALRELTQGRLITVFGCGGDRDRAKRPLMAKAAQQYADAVVLTSDNPRTEDTQQILNDAAAGFETHADAELSEASGTETYTLADRAEAIRFAIGLAGADDTVLIAGKGHEDYQIIGTEKIHFDDREHAAGALREKTTHT